MKKLTLILLLLTATMVSKVNAENQQPYQNSKVIQKLTESTVHHGVDEVAQATAVPVDTDILQRIEVTEETSCTCEDKEGYTLQTAEVVPPKPLIKNSGIMNYSPEMCDPNKMNINAKKLSRIISDYNIQNETGEYLFNHNVCAVFENKKENISIYTILWNKRENRVFYYLLLSNMAPYHAMVTVNEGDGAQFISKYQREYSKHALKKLDWKKMLDIVIDNENYF